MILILYYIFYTKLCILLSQNMKFGSINSGLYALFLAGGGGGGGGAGGIEMCGRFQSSKTEAMGGRSRRRENVCVGAREGQHNHGLNHRHSHLGTFGGANCSCCFSKIKMKNYPQTTIHIFIQILRSCSYIVIESRK